MMLIGISDVELLYGEEDGEDGDRNSPHLPQQVYDRVTELIKVLLKKKGKKYYKLFSKDVIVTLSNEEGTSNYPIKLFNFSINITIYNDNRFKLTYSNEVNKFKQCLNYSGDFKKFNLSREDMLDDNNTEDNNIGDDGYNPFDFNENDIIIGMKEIHIPILTDNNNFVRIIKLDNLKCLISNIEPEIYTVLNKWKNIINNLIN